MDNLNRQKRQRQTRDTWRKWIRQSWVTTTRAPNTEETITVDLPDWTSSFTTVPREYQTIPEPIFIENFTKRITRLGWFTVSANFFYFIPKRCLI